MAVSNTDVVAGRSCPACQAIDYSKRGTKDRFEILVCRRCRTLFTAMLPDADGPGIYDNYYTETNLTIPDFINQRLDEIVSGFFPYRQNGRLLDVGFGAGTLLEGARRARWEAYGVDVSASAYAHARSRGFEVFCGTLQAANYPENYFDVVGASEVLEHVPDPDQILREIARVLRPGGLLWLTTPHARGVSASLLGLKWSLVCPPEHLQLFSVGGLKQMLVESGFRCLRVATESVNPYELLQGLRGKKLGSAHQKAGDARVASCYELNEALMAGPSRRLLKSALNHLLSFSRLGDSLKVWAEKKDSATS